MKPFYYYPVLGIGKLIGPLWFFLFAVHFRRWGRNVVYNYVLNNDKRDVLKRLWQRRPYRNYDYWRLQTKSGVIGRVRYVRVNTLKFLAAFWLVWIWCDDDSVSDTYDDGHSRTFVYGERQDTIYARLFGR